MIIISGFIVALLASSFSAGTFAALFFMVLVTLISTAIAAYYANPNSDHPTVLRSGAFGAAIGYFIFGMGTAIILMIIKPFVTAGVILEFIYLLLLGGALVLLGLTTKGAGSREALELRRIGQFVSLESRIRALMVAVDPGSPEYQGLEKVSEEVRYFDKIAVSQFDKPFYEKLMELENQLLQKDAPAPLPTGEDPKALLNMATADPSGAETPAPAAPPPPPSDPPIKLINDMFRLASARHTDTARASRGGV
jgi:hypothetical protein